MWNYKGYEYNKDEKHYNLLDVVVVTVVASVEGMTGCTKRNK